MHLHLHLWLHLWLRSVLLPLSLSLSLSTKPNPSHQLPLLNLHQLSPRARARRHVAAHACLGVDAEEGVVLALHLWALMVGT